MYRLIVATVALLVSSPALAHGGGTKADGCHTKKSTGDYHCHTPKKARTDARTNARSDARGTTGSCSGNMYNCSDFGTHTEAQGVYESCLEQVGYDVHDLDRDDDGIACESLQ